MQCGCVRSLKLWLSPPCDGTWWCVRRAFVWSPELGGTAYNLTLQCLHRKLTNMWTSIF